MPDKPKMMCQTKRDTPVLQRWGFVGQASNLPTVKKKPHLLREPVRIMDSNGFGRHLSLPVEQWLQRIFKNVLDKLRFNIVIKLVLVIRQ